MLATVVAVASAAVFVLLLLDVSAGGFLHDRDPDALSGIVRLRPDGALESARWVTDLGTPVGIAVAGVVGAVVLRRRGAAWVAAVAPLAGALVAGAVTTALKAWVVPVRPPSGLRMPFEHEATFPSGHAAAATSLYVGLGLAASATCRTPRSRRLAVAAGAAMAGLVGASRLVLAVHWPTDVLGGWALGTALALAGWLVASRVDRPDAGERTDAHDPGRRAAATQPPSS